MEELQESEVLWPDNYSARSRYCDNEEFYTNQKMESESVQMDSSKPRSISFPENKVRSLHTGLQEFSTSDDEEEELAPPHEILAKRLSRKMASFSVCNGYGKALKGRDMRRVRNSVLKMTGFLESC